MEFFSLSTEMRTEIRLTGQMIQSMEILRMSSQDLIEYINKLYEENPVLELSESSELNCSFDDLQKKAGWISRELTAPTFAYEDRDMPEPAVYDIETESLSFFICYQLDNLNLSKPVYSICKYLAMMVDDNGYLDQNDIDNLIVRGVKEQMADEALGILQNLEPPGICARSLQECLLIQLRRMDNPSQTAIAIAEKHLSDLGQKHYGLISRSLGLPLKKVQEAEAIILSLEPRPGADFPKNEPVVYTRPDVYIIEEEGEPKAYLNEYYLPHISISSDYTEMLKNTSDQETNEYLRDRIRQVKNLIDNLSRRGRTLQRCADAIAETQRQFFLGKCSELKPMIMSELADSLELNISTISRAVHGKYVQSVHGVLPMRYFFNRTVGETVSRQAIKQKVLRLIQAEDHKSPYSDNSICQILEQEGISIARRTVAQYRAELNLKSSAVRKSQYRMLQNEKCSGYFKSN